MPVFRFEFADTEGLEPTHIESDLPQDQQKVSHMRQFLMEEVVYAAWKYSGPDEFIHASVSPEETLAKVTQLQSTLQEIYEADPTNLPIPTVFPILQGSLQYSYPETAIAVDNAVGIPFSYHKKLDGSLIRHYEGMQIDRDNLAEWLKQFDEDPAFEQQVHENDVNFMSWSAGPQLVDTISRTDNRTLGRLDDEGHFTPVVTVLNKEHPARAAQQNE